MRASPGAGITLGKDVMDTEKSLPFTTSPRKLQQLSSNIRGIRITWKAFKKTAGHPIESVIQKCAVMIKTMYFEGALR
jgi:hypothetical protein